MSYEIATAAIAVCDMPGMSKYLDESDNKTWQKTGNFIGRKGKFRL